MGRALGVDLGERWIGVAVSDGQRRVALPREVFERCGDRKADHLRLLRILEEAEATTVVVGMPTSLSGQQGPAAVAVTEEVEALKSVLGVSVEMSDERLSTASARRFPGAKLAPRSKRGAQGRMDAVAAAIILQAWLDGER